MSRERAKPPGNLQGLERWIGEWASDETSTPGRLRRRIGLIALVAMIDAVEDGDPSFIFKGGAAFELRFGNRARSTSDVDAVFRGNLDDSVAFLQRALAHGWSGFNGTLVDKGTFEVPGVRIPPRRSIAKLSYLGKPFLSLPIEVAAPEANALSEIDRVTVEPLRELGLGAPGPIPLLGVPYQIAQKLHACTTPDSENHVNERAHDLADLILLDELGSNRFWSDETSVSEYFRTSRYAPLAANDSGSTRLAPDLAADCRRRPFPGNRCQCCRCPSSQTRRTD